MVRSQVTSQSHEVAFIYHSVSRSCLQIKLRHVRSLAALRLRFRLVVSGLLRQSFVPEAAVAGNRSALSQFALKG